MLGYRESEALLHKFPVNLMRYQEACLELRKLRTQTDCQAQRYEKAGVPSGGCHSDPAANYAERIITLEGIIRALRGKIVPVMRVRDSIKNSPEEHCRVQFLIMELYYFGDMTLKGVAFHLRKGERYIFRQKGALVGKVMEETDKFGNSR